MIDESELRMLARSIALGVYSNAEEEAFKRLTHVFSMGRMQGKTEANQAASRARVAAAEKRAERLNG